MPTGVWMGRVVAWVGWWVICFSAAGCPRLEESGLGSLPPAVMTPEEPVRPTGDRAADAATRPTVKDSGATTPDPDDAAASPVGADAGVSVAGPIDAAAVDLAMAPADVAPVVEDVAAPVMDVGSGAPVLPVTHDRPPCLSMIGCGTQTSAGNRLSYPHAVAGGGENRYLVAGVAIGAAGREVAATFGGAQMTAIGTVVNVGRTCQVSLFGLAGPQPGNREVTVVVSGAPVGIVLSAASFTRVDQVMPYRADGFGAATGTGSPVLVVAPSGPGEVAVDVACVTASDGLNVFAPAAPSVPVFDALIGPDKEAVQSLRPSDESATTTMSYRLGGAGVDWAAGAVSLRPAP
jgi:hypothetical protein